MTPDPPRFSGATGILLTIEGLILIVLGALIGSKTQAALFATATDSVPLLQAGFIQLGLVCIGFLTLLWGVFEIVFRKEGPLVLVALLCLLPVLAPFGFLGFGSDPQAWLIALAPEGIQTDSVSSPLFRLLTLWLIPSTGWTGLFVANLLAGIAGVLIWLAIPTGPLSPRGRLVAILVLVQPAFLLAMVTGVESVWQTLFVSLSVVLFMRSLANEAQPGFGLIALSGISIGLAAGFQISSLATVPVFVAMLLLSGIGVGRAARAIGVFLLGAAAVGGVILLVSVFASAESGEWIPFQTADSETPLQRFLRCLPLPVFILLLSGILGGVLRWRGADSASRRLATLSILMLLVLAPAVLSGRGGIGFCVAAPFLAVVGAIGAPRMLTGLLVPLIAVSGFVTIDWVRDQSAQEPARTLFSAGPLAEEAQARFEGLRRAQQLLLIAPKEKTEVIVGEDWPLLAVLRGGWDRSNGVLRNPNLPVGYHDVVPWEEFDRLTAEGARFIAIPGAGERSKRQVGYDPLEFGATVWDPKKVHYR